MRIRSVCASPVNTRTGQRPTHYPSREVTFNLHGAGSTANVRHVRANSLTNAHTSIASAAHIDEGSGAKNTAFFALKFHEHPNYTDSYVMFIFDGI